MTRIRRVEVVANLASGGVDKDAPDEIEKIFADHGLNAHVCAPETHDLTNCLRAAVDAAPDLLVVLAGDGTARTAAELCGPEGPLLAPLPGGTMNLLPRTIYGKRSWQDALSLALAEGEARNLGGGMVGDHPFLVAAVLGSPALWAPAREAARYGEPWLALAWARRAFQRAFSGRLRYSLDGGEREKAEAVVFMCPHVSRAMADETPALEAAALDLHGTGDAFRLGLNALVRDWRDDPAVVTRPCRRARVWASKGIPALLDGELHRLSSSTEVSWRPNVARILAPPKED
ncbi:diacylglycerol/lipid kinase family protein [Phenylobacterium soli]|uniref:Diacylglycerol kinase family lipid kinase n=1 Tax=Phenylobacterium soli TaxID=2170551 RepID=A0A328AGX2_9CAUL|nr:diacylglycerol kinase family protein [Phenylobacterium soli]RAK53889.1 diacylglycerol kinase family lipid kinase [Phenylobacterium soli]